MESPARRLSTYLVHSDDEEEEEVTDTKRKSSEEHTSPRKRRTAVKQTTPDRRIPSIRLLNSGSLPTTCTKLEGESSADEAMVYRHSERASRTVTRQRVVRSESPDISSSTSALSSCDSETTGGTANMKMTGSYNNGVFAWRIRDRFLEYRIAFPSNIEHAHWVDAKRLNSSTWLARIQYFWHSNPFEQEKFNLIFEPRAPPGIVQTNFKPRVHGVTHIDRIGLSFYVSNQDTPVGSKYVKVNGVSLADEWKQPIAQFWREKKHDLYQNHAYMVIDACRLQNEGKKHAKHIRAYDWEDVIIEEDYSRLFSIITVLGEEEGEKEEEEGDSGL